MTLKPHICLCLLTWLLAPSAFAQKWDGVFQFPYLCDTYSNLTRLYELFKDSQQTKEEEQGFIALLNNRNCFTVEPQTVFQIVRRNNGAMQVELIDINVKRKPPQQSLGLYWGATEELSLYIKSTHQR